MLSYQFRGCNPDFGLPERIATVEGTLLASNLGFPEGPVIMPDGSVVFCDGNTGEMRSWKDGELGRSLGHRRFSVGRGARNGRRDLRHPGRQRPRLGRRERDLRHPAREPRRQRRAALLGDRRPHAGRPQRPGLRPRRPAVVHRLGHGAGSAGGGARDRQAVRAGRERRRRDARRAAERLPQRHRVRRAGPDVLDGVDGARRSPLGRRRGDDVLPAERRPRAGRHGVRCGRPAVRVHDDLRRPHGALPRGRGARGDHARPSTRPTASSTARRCT